MKRFMLIKDNKVIATADSFVKITAHRDSLISASGKEITAKAKKIFGQLRKEGIPARWAVNTDHQKDADWREEQEGKPHLYGDRDATYMLETFGSTYVYHSGAEDCKAAKRLAELLTIAGINYVWHNEDVIHSLVIKADDNQHTFGIIDTQANDIVEVD